MHFNSLQTLCQKISEVIENSGLLQGNLFPILINITDFLAIFVIFGIWDDLIEIITRPVTSGELSADSSYLNETLFSEFEIISLEVPF